jgi:hypothetical protein
MHSGRAVAAVENSAKNDRSKRKIYEADCPQSEAVGRSISKFRLFNSDQRVINAVAA